MRSFRTKISSRRQTFLLLAAQIERQLRDAYDRAFRAGDVTQASVAAKLGIDRSAVNRRLTGRTNMTIETIADMVWALDQAIKVEIFDPTTLVGLNYSIQTNQSAQPASASKAPSGSSNPLVPNFPQLAVVGS